MKRVATPTATPTLTLRANILLWVIAFVIACGTFAGLFWLGAIVASHVLRISVKDALIGILTAY